MTAKIYGKQSEYPKRIIKWTRYVQNFYIFFAGVFTYGFIAQMFSVADRLGVENHIITIVVLVIFMPIVYYTIHRILKILHKDKMSFEKGSKGEGRVFYELQKLPESFVAIQNMQLEAGWNIDFVVVGERKIFVVEVKSHSGTIGFDGERLVRDGKFFEKKILRQARSQAFSISDHILKNTNQEVWVEPVVVFTGSTKIHFGRRRLAGVYVIGISWLNDLLIEKDKEGKVLDKSFRELLVQQALGDEEGEIKGGETKKAQHSSS